VTSEKFLYCLTCQGQLGESDELFKDILVWHNRGCGPDRLDIISVLKGLDELCHRQVM